MWKRWNWPLIGFFVVMAALPIAALINDFVFDRCSAATLAEIAKEKPVFGCGEFFFNRYQTTVQTAFSFFLGAAGLIFVVRQLAELARQNEVARSALEATAAQLQIVQQTTKARAFVALGEFRNALGSMRVVLEKIRSGTLENPNHLMFDKSSKWLPDIFPGLSDDSKRERWSLLYSDYVNVHAFMFVQAGITSVDRLDPAAREGLPADFDQAMQRFEKTFAEAQDLLVTFYK